MEITDQSGLTIGEWAYREVSSPEGLVPSMQPEHFLQDLRQIMEDIHATIRVFPAMELTHLWIRREHRRKGHGRRVVGQFLREAKDGGYAYALVKIGKLNFDDCLEENTAFYVNCGWVRFITPTEYSLRFAYFDLEALQPA